MSSKIRVLVVEDSLTIRKHLVELLSADPAFTVVGEAKDGRSAIQQCEALRPDVVTMDMMLPVMSGLAATEYIMAFCPTPIVICSASMNRGEVFRTYDAISAGAVDVFPKLKPGDDEEAWATKFKSVVRIASRIKVVTHPRAKLATVLPDLVRSLTPSPHGAPPAPVGPPPPAMPMVPGRPLGVIAISASTGGPGAVRRVLIDLPVSFPLPILLVLHIGEPFDLALADWLDAQSPHRVVFATEGMPVVDGGPRVIMSPGGKHMFVSGGRVRLGSGPERHSCRPSVDVLFESVATEYGSAAGAVLMTGMGRDGADGLLAIRRVGGRTIAQDEATCVIYGMPRAAVMNGAAESVQPLDGIAAELVRLAAGARP